MYRPWSWFHLIQNYLTTSETSWMYMNAAWRRRRCEVEDVRVAMRTLTYRPFGTTPNLQSDCCCCGDLTVRSNHWIRVHKRTYTEVKITVTRRWGCIFSPACSGVEVLVCFGPEETEPAVTHYSVTLFHSSTTTMAAQDFNFLLATDSYKVSRLQPSLSFHYSHSCFYCVVT